MTTPIRLAACLVVLAGLASCGVDGPPIPPSDNAETPEPGVSISGNVSMGVVGGSGTSSVSATRN